MSKCIYKTVSVTSAPGPQTRRTENTIKKKGLKWSNISVKKYHHIPGFGVRSGSMKPAPQVFAIQPMPPAAAVDAATRTRKCITNSSASGMAFIKLTESGFGEARCERASVSSMSKIGGTRRIDGRERLDASAAVNKAGDGLRSEVNLSVSRRRAFSNVDVAVARDGKKR
jgi:hypothetical protein